MAPADTKQGEKSYLTRSGSAAWEAAKPFSQPGVDTLGDSAQLLHDFAVAMLSLRPASGDLILDLGAGGCWCSDLLHRLNRRSVAVDISVEMLRVGRSRPNGTSIPAAAADLESLPFRSGVFNKALCLNAIHHVPDIPTALKEISRVLTDDGVALFSEPGRGHAGASVSVAAMRDFGVLEQDILIGGFARSCREAGFRDVRLKVLSYAIPIFDLTPEEWSRWSGPVSRKRPVRALAKLGRACLELFGLGKRGPLFEETFERSVIRALFGAMQDHPIIVASKLPPDEAAGRVAWSALVKLDMAEQAVAGRGLPATVTVTNLGPAAWPAVSRTGIGHVTLGVQLLDAQQRVLARDFHRVPLPHDVAPGQSVQLVFECPPPDTRGSYVLKFDLVAEGITWFEAAGSRPAVHSLRVG